MRDLTALQLLRQAGASFTLRCPADGNNTALHYAAMLGLHEMVSYMIPLIPRYQLMDTNLAGDSPLHVACRYGHYSLIPLFLEHAVRLWKEDVFVFQSLRRRKESELEESLHVLKKRKSLMELEKAPLPKVLKAMLINVSSPTEPLEDEVDVPEGETVLHLVAKNRARDPRASTGRPTDTELPSEVTTPDAFSSKTAQRTSGAWLNVADRHVWSVWEAWGVQPINTTGPQEPEDRQADQTIDPITTSTTTTTTEAAATEQATSIKPLDAYSAATYLIQTAKEHQLLVPLLLTRTLYFGDCALALAGDDRMLDLWSRSTLSCDSGTHCWTFHYGATAALDSEDETEAADAMTTLKARANNNTKRHATRPPQKHF